jgi:hypothetical protein
MLPRRRTEEVGGSRPYLPAPASGPENTVVQGIWFGKKSVVGVWCRQMWPSL